MYLIFVKYSWSLSLKLLWSSSMLVWCSSVCCSSFCIFFFCSSSSCSCTYFFKILIKLNIIWSVNLVIPFFKVDYSMDCQCTHPTRDLSDPCGIAWEVVTKEVGHSVTKEIAWCFCSLGGGSLRLYEALVGVVIISVMGNTVVDRDGFVICWHYCGWKNRWNPQRLYSSACLVE